MTRFSRGSVARLQAQHYSGKKRIRKNPDDPTTHELYLYAINDGDLYRQKIQPILKNLAGKIRKGIYNPELALKLWKYAADDAAKAYTFEYGDRGHAQSKYQVKGYGIFSVATRVIVAKEMQRYYDVELGEMDTRKVPYRNPMIKRRTFILHLKTPAGWKELASSYKSLFMAKRTANAIARKMRVPVRITAGR